MDVRWTNNTRSLTLVPALKNEPFDTDLRVFKNELFDTDMENVTGCWAL